MKYYKYLNPIYVYMILTLFLLDNRFKSKPPLLLDISWLSFLYIYYRKLIINKYIKEYSSKNNIIYIYRNMFDSFSDFFDSSPLDGLLMRNKSVLDVINEDIFTDINLHAPSSRISVIIDSKNEVIYMYRNMLGSLSDLFDRTPLDGILTQNKSVLDEINEDIFTDINLHAPASRISVTVDSNNSGNLQLNPLSSMVLTITHNNTMTPIGPLYENININDLDLGYNNNVIITNPNIIAAFNNAPRGYQFNLSIKYTYTYTFTGYNSNVESTVNYGSYIPKP